MNLRPCPFCGESAAANTQFAGIICRLCGGAAPDHVTWNRRDAEDAALAAAQKLRKLLEAHSNPPFSVGTAIAELDELRVRLAAWDNAMPPTKEG